MNYCISYVGLRPNYFGTLEALLSEGNYDTVLAAHRKY